MKIGDEIFVHGYIDEIRKDVIIIKNDGGYFGTVPNEVKSFEKLNIDTSNLKGAYYIENIERKDAEPQGMSEQERWLKGV